MGYREAVDISQYQGAYRDYGTPVVFIKMSGGDVGVYYDSRASENYYGAKSQGKQVGLYHFAGGTDPVVEADFFVRACSPLEENDVLVLDWEVGHHDPVGWCSAFVHRVHDQTGVWPLLYINLATLRAHDWTPVLTLCGLWIAAWNENPNIDINTAPWNYVVHQYRGEPLDLDAVWLSEEQFNAYGYHAAPQPVPTTTTTTTEAPAPAPTTTTTTTVAPSPNPTTTTTTTTQPVPPPLTTTTSTTRTTTQQPGGVQPGPLVVFILWLLRLITRRKK